VKAHGEGYRAKILRLLDEAKLTMPPGSITDVYIGHAPTCPAAGDGADHDLCRCDPDIVAFRRGAA
jgi:hypothetical protein